MKKTARGFTLVELLVVIAIIAILAVIVAVVINPLEMRRRSNDAARLSDMASLQQAINISAQEATQSGEDILCKPPASAPCTGDSQGAQTNTALRASDGTGWVKVDLKVNPNVSMPTLPIDPVNDGTYYYKYASNGTAWEINARLESTQQKSKVVTDGGDSNDPTTGWYEVGSDLTLMQ